MKLADRIMQMMAILVGEDPARGDVVA